MTDVTTNDPEAGKRAALQEAEEYGKREGGGAAARAGFYQDLIYKAKVDKVYDVQDDADCWDRYSKGASKGASIVGGVGRIINDPEKEADTRKVRISECRQFLKLGANVYLDGVEVMDRAMRIIKEHRLDGRLKSKPTDAMLAVARAQNKDEHNPLDDSTIESVIYPRPSNEKPEADRLEKVRESLEAIEKKFGESDEVTSAIGYVQKRIDDLGGTTAYKKAQKALAAANAKKGAI